MRKAWKNPNADEGERDLRELARQPERINPDAAGSLREGLGEMFTVTRLGVRGTLLATLMSANPVESIDRDRAQPRPLREALAARRHAPALGSRRHAGGREAVPAGEGLQPAPTARFGDQEHGPEDPRLSLCP